MIPIRYKPGDDRNVALKTITPDHFLVGTPCPACDELFVEADPVMLVYVGPGDDPEERAKAVAGRFHVGAAVALHEACAAPSRQGDPEVRELLRALHPVDGPILVELYDDHVRDHATRKYPRECLWCHTEIKAATTATTETTARGK